MTKNTEAGLTSSDGASTRFAGAIACRTISHEDRARDDRAAFEALHRHLGEAFPRTHRELKAEPIGDHFALLYTWPGSDPDLKPWLAVSHQDVVGVEQGTEADWAHPPFAGAIADGFVWGRGAVDLKATLTGVLEAVEQLIGSSFRPRRTLFLAFGADEEVGGRNGAALIAAELAARGVRLAATLDEGGIIVTDGIAGLRRPLASIGLAQKGEARFQLTIRGEGGHSSIPPQYPAASRLAEAIERLDRNPMPARIDGATGELLRAIARHGGFWARLAIANLWATAPLLRWWLRRDPATNALIRSTMAVTRIAAGVSDNVVPQSASAVIDVRLKPGDTVAAAENHIRRTLDGLPVAIERTAGIEASRVSPVDSEFYRCLVATIGTVAPDALAVPCLSFNDTDSKHYEPLSDAQYRFYPLRLHSGELDMIHGTNERVKTENYLEVVEFFKLLIQAVDRSQL